MANVSLAVTRTAAILIAAVSLSGAAPRKVSPIPGLAATDAEVLVEYLGPSVVGGPRKARTIEDPLAWFPFEPSTFTFNVTGGSRAGTVETHVYRSPHGDEQPADWTEQISDDQTIFLRRSDEGSITIEGEITHDRNKLSRFSPGELLVPSGIEPGETRTRKLDVAVYSLSDLDHVRYTGTVDVTCTYLGTFDVRVPSGDYEAALFKWTNQGKVGPANVAETEYRFLAEGVGTVAMVIHRSVDAWLVYRTSMRAGKVLDHRSGA